MRRVDWLPKPMYHGVAEDYNNRLHQQTLQSTSSAICTAQYLETRKTPITIVEALSVLPRLLIAF